MITIIPYRNFHLWRIIFLGILLLVFILPILWTGAASLNVQPDDTQTPLIWSWPPSLQNYFEVHDMQTYFWQELFTSIFISALVMALVCFISFLASYALANASFRGHELLIHSLLIVGSLPTISYAIPLSLSLRHWHLFDTPAGVILAESASLTPLAVFILVGYMRQLERELEAEAQLNGAALHQILWYVIFPSVTPGLTATCAIVFILSWNQYVVPLVLSGTYIRVIPVMMRDFFALEREFEWPAAATVIMISLMPAGLFVAATHRILERFSLMAPTESEG